MKTEVVLLNLHLPHGMLNAMTFHYIVLVYIMQTTVL